MRIGRYLLYAAASFGALAIAFGIWNPIAAAKEGGSRVAPRYKVDPFWPKPLPAPEGRQWVTGEPGGSCIDSQDHVITVNRGNLTSQDGTTSIPSPPVLEYDPDGNVVRAWGDRAVLPNGIHGCFVDYQDNIWITGNGDGVAQKWSHDGTTMLLQIGIKGKCDWPANNFACGNSANDPTANQSEELLNQPAELVVDSDPDPETGVRGSVYIADGYGNHRVVVFSATGQYLRQWGRPGNGAGEFFVGDGGHPHCIALGKDGLIYACDRSNHRIQVFDKLGNLKRIIAVDPPTSISPLGLLGTLRATDIAFSNDRNQTWIFDTDLGNNKVWILDRALGVVVSGFGNSGQMAGEFIFPHTIDVDSKGNIYVAETINGRRIQKFVPRGNRPVD
jgi:sugar lactone lactonase YvrE